MPSINVRSQDRLILALDTSSSLGSVAISRGEVILKTCSFEADHGHSTRLLPAIDRTFAEAGLSSSQVDLFAAVIGPGSFTGLRVSLASLRGLAGSKPCFGALATDVAAWAAKGRTSHILAVTDLFHGEVFASVHDESGKLLSGRESGELSAVLSRLEEWRTDPCAAVGSATSRHRAALESAWPGLTIVSLEEGLAPHLAALAAASATEEDLVSASDLLPFYLRDPLTRGLLNTQPKNK